MPTMPVTFRSHTKPSRIEQERSYDSRRREAKPWRAWYKLPIWQAIRRKQLSEHPLCERCQAEGVTRAATVCNHKGGHKGDWQLFINGPFESACKPHHDRDVQAEERKGEGGPKV